MTNEYKVLVADDAANTRAIIKSILEPAPFDSYP